jgi:SEC-C motif-containing protein
MRARYTAHVNVDVDFLFKSTHPDHRSGFGHKETKDWAENSEWYGLEILDSTKGGIKDDTGEVEFIARLRDREGRRSHHERARFSRVKKQWYFIDGTMVKSPPVNTSKIGRNEPCPCGSGSKYKKCCGQ